ncbi:hypothetical protein JSY36_05395 [Bacillus sp. H-16]|uniref:hypothetical protein n=1 Tax=Alteribacter salitolerans TaxID=2912333 RepID=UPI0019652744|nr:hypothetical protein [Alteribacter salitolerans]MBM7095186.1 hypothetical protein [Alteribacter salitolerans]
MAMAKRKRTIVVALLLGVIAFITIHLQGADKDLIESTIREEWHVRDMQHIELVDDTKAVAFFETADGVEREVYMEKSWFRWTSRIDYTFEPAKKNYPFFLSFFGSPYHEEGDMNMVLVRVFDQDISTIQLEHGDAVLTELEILTKGSDQERFALVRSDNDAMFKADFIAYNSDGEVVYTNSPPQ